MKFGKLEIAWMFLVANRNKIANLLWLAAPIVAGVVSGGVFTAPTIITAVGVLAGKYAQSPVPPPVPMVMQKVAKAAKVNAENR